MTYLITNSEILYGYTDSKKIAKQFIKQIKVDHFFEINKDRLNDIEVYRKKDPSRELVWFQEHVMTISDAEDFYSTFSGLILDELYDSCLEIVNTFKCINPKFLNKDKLKPLLDICSSIKNNTFMDDGGRPMLSYLLAVANTHSAVEYYVEKYIVDIPF